MIFLDMVAPLRGKIVILVLRSPGMSLACLGSGFGENGITYAFISIIWFVPVVWVNVIWAMCVSMVASLVARLLMTA